MTERRIRPVAVGVPTRDGEVLLAEHRDPAGHGRFYRPVGGQIEFGEHSRAALRREFAEELDATVSDATPLGTFEDVFEADGERRHEIWLCYRVELAEDWPYGRDAFDAREPETGESFRVRWLATDRLADLTVYPEELPDRL